MLIPANCSQMHRSRTKRSQLELARQNIVAQKTQIEILKQNIRYATIKAPVTGYVSKRKIQNGQMVRTGTQLFSIVQSDDLWVTANFKETQIAAFPVGKRVKIIADAYPNDFFMELLNLLAVPQVPNLPCCLPIMQPEIM
jgi:membrane fusion protein (multidrug efflux system)